MASLLYSAVLSAASWRSAPVPASPQVRGLDAPRAYLQRPIGPSPTSPGGVRVRNCLVHRTFAVLWTEDPGLIGAPDLEIRQIRSDSPAKEACADGFTGKRTVSDKFSDTVPVGAVDKYLVLVYPDGAGVLTSLEFIDISSGRLVSSLELNWEKGIDFKSASSQVVATYWRALASAPCVPFRGSDDCWRRIRAAAGLPPLQGVPAPECDGAAAAWREKSTPPPAAFQITIKVREVLGDGGFEVLPDTPTCDLAP